MKREIKNKNVFIISAAQIEEVERQLNMSFYVTSSYTSVEPKHDTQHIKGTIILITVTIALCIIAYA